MADKKVTIVLPVYNGEDYISFSIDSIIGQTYKNWELIIVNDHSTDNTLSICNEYSAKYDKIKVISNEKNLKLPGTLNNGFDHATGDYYTWTSHDNIYKPDALEKLVYALSGNPDAVMVYSDYTNIDENGNLLDSVKLLNPQFIVITNVCGASFMYTAEVAKKVGKYDVNLFLAEDYDYWMRVSCEGEVIHIIDDLYLYRRHSGTLTETKKSSINEQTYKALEKNFLHLYAEAKKCGLEYQFFDHMLSRGCKHTDETLSMLLSVDGGYKRYLNRKTTIEKMRNTEVYKLLCKLIKE